MSLQVINLRPESATHMRGMRQSAVPLRQDIEAALAQGNGVSIDFSGVEATQSFIDELIGVLVASKGPSVLQGVQFKGCSDNVKGVLKFVVADRARDFLKSRH